MLRVHSHRLSPVSKKDITLRNIVKFPVVRKPLHQVSFIESYLGKESELKMKLRRYVPSQGWSSLTYIYKNLAPSLSTILIESSLKELMWGLRGCRIENDWVCRNDWMESNPVDPSETSEGKTRAFANEAELADAMLPYIPRDFVPLRAIALQTPIDIFPALRDSRFSFLLRHPDKFVVAQCVDDNAIVARSLSNVGRCRVLYQRYRFLRHSLIAAALAIPSKDPLSEIDCMHRIPKTYRRRILSSGYSFSTLASIFSDLFSVEREDDFAFATSIRSKISDPEKSHPDNPRITSRAITKIMSSAGKKLLKCVENADMSIFRKISAEEDFLQTALDIREGKAALKYSKRVGAVRDELIQNEIIGCLSGERSKYVEYDELLLKLSPKVRRQLAYEDGGLRKFIAGRPKIFNLAESETFTRISWCGHLELKSDAKVDSQGESSKSDSKPTCVEAESKEGETWKNAEPQKRSDHTEINTNQSSCPPPLNEDECDSILSLSNIQNMKEPGKKEAKASKDIVEPNEEAEEAEEDLLASEVARFVPVKGISGIAIRDLALQIGKNMRKRIQAEGFKTFNEFIYEYPEWFLVTGEGDNLYVNLSPFESAEEESVSENESLFEDHTIESVGEGASQGTETLSPFQSALK